jgi:hypothetical protein
VLCQIELAGVLAKTLWNLAVSMDMRKALANANCVRALLRMMEWSQRKQWVDPATIPEPEPEPEEEEDEDAMIGAVPKPKFVEPEPEPEPEPEEDEGEKIEWTVPKLAPDVAPDNALTMDRRDELQVCVCVVCRPSRQQPTPVRRVSGRGRGVRCWPAGVCRVGISNGRVGRRLFEVGPAAGAPPDGPI